MEPARITVDPRVRWGTPCIRDTGVTVKHVLALAAAGRGEDEILADCPELEAGDVDAAAAWCTAHGAESLRPHPPDPGSTHPRVVVDHDVQGGYPTIRGTRIPVDVVVGCWERGLTIGEVLAEYPGLTREDVEDALAYAADAGV